MDNQETVQAAIDGLRQDIEGLKTLLHLKDTKMEFLLANLAKTENELAAAEQRMDDLLLGSIATFAMPEPPQGWLLCDGQEVSRQAYARLFAKIGTTFGEGDGEETFNLPDLRGVFVRGWDGERVFGSHQEDQMQGHTHRDGGHSHEGSTGSAGSHGHAGKTGIEGYHNHFISHAATDDNPFLIMGYFIEIPSEKEVLADENKYHAFHPSQGNANGEKMYSALSMMTNIDGTHTHSLSINSAGSHAHTFTTTSASASISTPVALLDHGKPRCGDETRLANVALLFCIKY